MGARCPSKTAGLEPGCELGGAARRPGMDLYEDLVGVAPGLDRSPEDRAALRALDVQLHDES